MTSRRSSVLPLVLALVLTGCGGGGSGDAGGAPDAGSHAGSGSDSGAGTGTEGSAGLSGSGATSSASGVRLVEIATTLSSGQVRTDTFGWDDEGRLLSETLSEGGSLLESRRYIWTENTRFSSREDDLGGDGSVDRSVDFSFTPDGKLGSARIAAADGSPLGALVYSVGEDGNVESLEATESGVLIRRETFSYSTGGDLESSAIDRDGDGAIDSILGFDYAENGTVAATIESDANPPAGGGGEVTAVWTYERGECIRDWFNSVYRPYCVTFR